MIASVSRNERERENERDRERERECVCERERETGRETETERDYRDYNNIGKYVSYLKIQRYDKPVECNLYKCWNFHPCSATNKIASRM